MRCFPKISNGVFAGKKKNIIKGRRKKKKEKQNAQPEAISGAD